MTTERKNVTEMTCDECGKFVTDNGITTFGGNVFGGWMTLNLRISTTLVENRKTQYDFCSMECLHTYSHKKHGEHLADELITSLLEENS